MTISTLTILTFTGSMLLLKLGIMVMAVVLLARAMSAERPLFQPRMAMAKLPDANKTRR